MVETRRVRARGEVHAVVAGRDDQGRAHRLAVELGDLEPRAISERLEQPAVIARGVEAEGLALIRRDEHLVQDVRVARATDADRHPVALGTANVGPVPLREAGHELRLGGGEVEADR